MKSLITIFAAIGLTVTGITATNDTESVSLSAQEYAALTNAATIANRLYEVQMSTEGGRVAYHGKVVADSVDTNALTRTYTYKSGYTFTTKIPKSVGRSKGTGVAGSKKQTAIDKTYTERLKKIRERRIKARATTNVVTIVNSPNGKQVTK